jgi:uncharacterized damage-inducible protein DinB
MTQPDFSATDLLRWWRLTSDNWRRLLADNPGLLEAPCDIAGTTTVAGLLQHLIGSELRHAELAAWLGVDKDFTVPMDSVGALYAVHDRAAAVLEQLAVADVDWNEKVEFTTRTGARLRVTRHILFLHAMLQAIRHYAQLATLVRQHGVKPNWPMDILFLDVERL